jgi:hypothetical protein
VSRRGTEPQLVYIYWRDIPAQVNAQAGRERAQRILEGRFQVAIDKAAMVAKIVAAQDYTAEFRRVAKPCGPELEAEAIAAAAAIEEQYPRERLQQIVLNGGWDPAAGSTPATD